MYTFIRKTSQESYGKKKLPTCISYLARSQLGKRNKIILFLGKRDFEAVWLRGPLLYLITNTSTGVHSDLTRDMVTRYRHILYFQPTHMLFTATFTVM